MENCNYEYIYKMLPIIIEKLYFLKIKKYNVNKEYLMSGFEKVEKYEKLNKTLYRYLYRLIYTKKLEKTDIEQTIRFNFNINKQELCNLYTLCKFNINAVFNSVYIDLIKSDRVMIYNLKIK